MARKRGRPPAEIRWTEARQLADAGVSAPDIAAVLMPPDLSGLPTEERLRREAELGEARLRAELQVLARAKALGRGRVARKVSVVVLLAECRARLGWDKATPVGQQPPDLEGAKARLLALWAQQRANLVADGSIVETT